MIFMIMKKLSLVWSIALIVVILEACCSTLSVDNPATPNRLIDEGATIAIISTPTEENPDNVTASCAGVWVSMDEFLTAGHCVDSGARLLAMLMSKFISQNNVEYSAIGTKHRFVTVDVLGGHEKERTASDIFTATVTAYDEQADVALLRADEIPNDHPVAVLSDGQI